MRQKLVLVASTIRLLLADDDRVLSDLLTEYLSGEGYEVKQVFDGESAVALMRNENFDLAVLDIMMPGRNGLDALASVRRSSDIPIIMLTARGEDIDRIVGLELGADDYLAKPCNPRELVARINAVLRRTGRDRQADSRATVVYGDLTLHRSKRQVMVGERNAGLTSTEFDVLRVLVENAGVAVSKADLSAQALGRVLGPYDRGIEMHLSHIRRKLGASPSGEERIVTVRNYGYLFVVPD